MRGEVYGLRSLVASRAMSRAGTRYAVVVQSDLLPLSTWLVVPTSTSARAATFRPEVSIEGPLPPAADDRAPRLIQPP